MKAQLEFKDLKANQSVPIEAAPRLRKQARTIYAELRRGPLWTNNLRAMACQYNARIRELRQWLMEFGLTIDCTLRAADGNNRYELRPFAGSRYEAELMSRQRMVRQAHHPELVERKAVTNGA